MKDWIYNNKGTLVIGSLLLLGSTFSGSGNSSSEAAVPAIPEPVQQVQQIQLEEVIKPIEQTSSFTQSVGLSNDNYYENSDGHEVHSPAYSDDDSIPAGATARCRDGTYSFSQHKSGTCSHHGGVAEWI